MNGLFDNFLVTGIVNYVQVEVTSKDFIDMLRPYGVFVVVVDDLVVVVVGHQQLINSLVEIETHMFIVLHLISFEEDLFC